MKRFLYIRFLSWKSRSADPRSIFYPHSSWTQGRNRLLKETAGTSYQYYIFLDDDVEMRAIGDTSTRNPWRLFEEFLTEYEPAVGVPRYNWHLIGGGLDTAKPAQSLRFFDALLNAFHREALLTLLRAGFLRQTVGPAARHVQLGEPGARSHRSYEVPLDELERRFFTDHPPWLRKRQRPSLRRNPSKPRDFGCLAWSAATRQRTPI